MLYFNVLKIKVLQMKLLALAGFLALSTSISLHTNAQVQVGSAQSVKGPGKISAIDMNALKQTTTYFMLQESDYDNLQAFENAIAKVWTITPFKIIHPSEMDQYDQNKSSFFFFGGFMNVRTGTSTTTINPHMSYDLFMLETEKGKTKQKIFGKFLLHLDGESYLYAMKYAQSNSKHFSNNIIPYLYSKASMNNWSPLMLSGYLKIINDGLLEGKLRSVFDEYTDNEGLKALKSQVLYIPNYVNVKFNMFTGAEKDTEQDDENVKSSYAYPNQFLSMQELEEKANSTADGIHYLSYIKSSTDKYINVFNSKTGALLYTNYVPASYNFKNKDLKKLAGKIK